MAHTLTSHDFARRRQLATETILLLFDRGGGFFRRDAFRSGSIIVNIESFEFSQNSWVNGHRIRQLLIAALSIKLMLCSDLGGCLADLVSCVGFWSGWGWLDSTDTRCKLLESRQLQSGFRAQGTLLGHLGEQPIDGGL